MAEFLCLKCQEFSHQNQIQKLCLDKRYKNYLIEELHLFIIDKKKMQLMQFRIKMEK